MGLETQRRKSQYPRPPSSASSHQKLESVSEAKMSRAVFHGSVRD